MYLSMSPTKRNHHIEKPARSYTYFSFNAATEVIFRNEPKVFNKINTKCFYYSLL